MDAVKLYSDLQSIASESGCIVVLSKDTFNGTYVDHINPTAKPKLFEQAELRDENRN